MLLGERGNALNEQLSKLTLCAGDDQGIYLYVKSPLCYSTEPAWYSDDGTGLLHFSAEGYAEFGKQLAMNAELNTFPGMCVKGDWD